MAADKVVQDLQERVDQCEKETDRYLGDRILKYERLHGELLKALEVRKKARAHADERTVYDVSGAPDFDQSICLIRAAKVAEEFIRPLADAQSPPFLTPTINEKTTSRYRRE